MQLSDLDLSKTYSYADYFRWDFEEHVELIEGNIFVLPSFPGTTHQRVSGAMSVALYRYMKGKSISVFSAPFDVRLPRKSKDDKEIFTVVQPDICVICDQSKLDERGCLGAPDIVVEILSPGNNKKELDNKFDAYQEALVKEYWIIHPNKHTFLRYMLNNENKFEGERLLTSGNFVTTELLPGFSLNLEEVFAEVL